MKRVTSYGLRVAGCEIRKQRTRSEEQKRARSRTKTFGFDHHNFSHFKLLARRAFWRVDHFSSLIFDEI